MSDCNTVINVTGTAPSICQMRTARRPVLVPKYAADGSVNRFDSAAAVTKAAFQAKLDETDPLDRFYALPLLEEVEDVRADPEFQEYSSKRKSFLMDGVRSFKALMPDGDPQYLGRINTWLNHDFGVFMFDEGGNMIYNYDQDGYIIPVPVDGRSFWNQLKKQTYNEESGVMIYFDFAETAKDSLLRMIPFADLDFDGRTGDLYGLQALRISIVTKAIGTTTVVDVSTDYGVAVAGLVFGDFSLLDVDTAGDLAVTAAPESTTVPGRYTLTHTTTVALHTNRLTVAKVKYQSAVKEFISE